MLWKDEPPRRCIALFKALMKKAGVLSFFQNLSFTNRKEIAGSPPKEERGQLARRGESP